MPISPPRRARANVFDVARTDRDEPASPPPAPLGQILAPLGATSAAAPVSALPEGQIPAQYERPAAPEDPSPRTRSGRSGPVSDVPRRPRGNGGRVTATGTRITVTAARIPISLYEAAEYLVKGPGKPSWGQLIAAACEGNHEEVVEAVVDRLGQDTRGGAPRGQNRRAVATTQITARFAPDELAPFQAAMAEAIARAQRLDGASVTATAVVTAALDIATGRQAVRSGPP